MVAVRRITFSFLLAMGMVACCPHVSAYADSCDGVLPGQVVPGCFDGTQDSQNPPPPQEEPDPQPPADDPPPAEPADDQPAPQTPSNPAPPADADDPLIPNVQDPDDDDDGATDNVDMNPEDPNVGANPDIPVEDGTGNADGDLLPDVLDPDDDNDGTVDNQDPEPVPANPESPSGPADPAAPAPTTNGPADSSATDRVPQAGSPVDTRVLALPNTGTAPQRGDGQHGAGMVLQATATSTIAILLIWNGMMRSVRARRA